MAMGEDGPPELGSGHEKIKMVWNGGTWSSGYPYAMASKDQFSDKLAQPVALKLDPLPSPIYFRLGGQQQLNGRFKSAAQNHELNASIVYFLLSMVETFKQTETLDRL